MSDLHITEIIAVLGLCLGYLAVTIGNAIAFRIRYGRLTPGSLVPHEAEQAVADAKITRKRRRRAAELEVAPARPAPPPATATPLAPPTPPAPRDMLEAELEARGIATPIARAAAKHARASLGNGTDRGALVREALRACPGKAAA